MKIKKYLVSNMNDALRMIRDDMGPEAVIISSHRLPRKGLFDFFSPRLIEVTAALDERRTMYNTAIPTQNNQENNSFGKLLSILSSYEKNGNSNNPTAVQVNSAESVENFKPGLKFKEDTLDGKEVCQQWKDILTSLDISEKTADKLLSSINHIYQDETLGINEMYEAYMILLKSKISKLLEPAYQSIQQRRVSAFVGPSGVGKTLTLAKIATHFKLFEGKKVAIISANYDNRRPDLTESLRYYCNLVGLQVETAESREELVELTGRMADQDIVLVDTPGTNSKNTGSMLKLKNLLQPFHGKWDIYLVLSSPTKSQDLIRTALDYQKHINYTKTIFTKLDETETCGAILEVVNRTQVPVTFVSYGQNVPDDITAVNNKKLAGLLLGGVERFVGHGLQNI